MEYTTFLSPVIKKLVDLLADEVNLLSRVHQEAKSLKDELEIIEPFLRDAEVKSDRGELNVATKTWLKQLREVSEHIEYVIDEYSHRLERRSNARGCQQGLFGTLQRAVYLKPRRDIATEIRDIKVTLREIKDRGQSYALRPFEQASSSEVLDPRIDALFVSDDEFVGMDSATKELVRDLVEEGQYGLKVISVVGEGGIGKTTLVKKVFEDREVKSVFEIRVWINVSQSCSTRKMLQVLMNHTVPTAIPNVREIEEMVSVLRNSHLATTKYVVVFDDVWQTEFWNVIKYALPNYGKHANRIIITTRNKSVADFFKQTSCDVIRELKSWSTDQAWLLFCMKAFGSGQSKGCCPVELEPLARKIVRKCQGLPLVIVAVAGSLSRKEKTLMEWQQVHDYLEYCEFEENPQLTKVSKILSLSYNDLPYHLKPCLLYFSIFPGGVSIREEKIHEIWIAEGFIKPKRGKTMEEVAGEYLNELIGRNLVLFEETQTLGYIRWCRVHDLIREVILTKSNEICFAHFLTFNKTGSNHFGANTFRRLSIADATSDAMELLGNSTTRSIFLFKDGQVKKNFVACLIEKFELLKLLDLENTNLDKLPKEIGKLVHLESLNLRGTDLKTLPKSIGKLKKLQTLDVFGTLVRMLPVEINNLKSLRFLQAYCREDHDNERACSDKGVVVHHGIGNLKELRKLETIKANSFGTCFLKELEMLSELRVLMISSLTGETGKSIGNTIEKMRHLEKLSLFFINKDEVFYAKCISSPPPFLRYLNLSCQLDEFPKWTPKLLNLRGLTLCCSNLTSDNEPLKYLKDLANLVFLNLDEAYQGEELHFGEGGFQKLKQLMLRKMGRLKTVRIDKNAMPLLEELLLGKLPLMRKIPWNIQLLRKLEFLEIEGMHFLFVESLNSKSGHDYWKIQHIPSVQFWDNLDSTNELTENYIRTMGKLRRQGRRFPLLYKS